MLQLKQLCIDRRQSHRRQSDDIEDDFANSSSADIDITRQDDLPVELGLNQGNHSEFILYLSSS